MKEPNAQATAPAHGSHGLNQGKSASPKSAHETQTQQEMSPGHPAPLTWFFALCWASSPACAPNTPRASQGISAACKQHLYSSIRHQG